MLWKYMVLLVYFSTAMDLSDSGQAEADNVKEARKSNPCPKHK